MNRFLCKRTNISSSDAVINDKQQVHHIKDVLKLKAGEKVVIFDGQGSEYNCTIINIAENVNLKIKSKVSPRQDKQFKLTVACAIPKKAKIDDIIDKLVQLGVYRFIPLKTERVIVKLDKPKEALRLERWNKIALSAAKQSQRNTLLVMDPVRTLDELIAKSDEFDLKLIPCLTGERRSLKKVLVTHVNYSNVIVLIGPEGDFSPSEVNMARRGGFLPVSLGSLILRVDTAAIAAASFIKLYENC